MTPDLLRRWLPVGAVVLLLGLAALATARSSPELRAVGVEPPASARSVPSRSPSPSSSPAPASTAAEPGQPVELGRDGLPGWVAPVLGGLCTSAVLGLVVVIASMLLRDRLRRRVGSLRTDGAAPAGTGAAAEVVAALDAGLQDLSDTDVDPRRAVIACWLRLEQAAAAAGTPRKPDDTSTDLVTRLLREHDVSAAVLTAFAEVYRESRYATHTVDETMRTQARSAVVRLRGELAAGARA